MRQIPETMAVSIESGAATLCHVWVLERTDGVVAGFTDHDRDLEMAGVLCRASSGWTRGAAESGVGLSPGTAVVAGVLEDEGIPDADVEAGLLDHAQVSLWRVDWRHPDRKVRLWVARLVRIRREGERFFGELEGPLATLDRVAGRTYGRDCDAQLGDARCTVDLESFPGASCDKRWATCRGTFGNGVNFQGFPDIPGDDFLTAVPVQGGRNDGGSRR